MNDLSLHPAPAKTMPVLIGALAMTATAVIPVLNFVNCLCCAGIMGGAVLGAWFYKKNFPPDVPYTVGNGTLIGTLSGIIAGILTSIIQALEMGVLSAGFAAEWDSKIQEIMAEMDIQGTDPATAEQIRSFLESLLLTPGLFILLIFGGSVIVFTIFGMLGGVIGGNIFKTRVVPQINTPTRPGSEDPVS